MTPLLKLSDVGKRFGGLSALRGLSLSVEPGRVLGLIGPNGSGKTTTINIVTGIYRPTSGQVLLGGKDVTGFQPHRIMRAGMARTFQNLRLFPTRSVLDNIRAGQHVRLDSWLTFLSAVPTAEEKLLRAQAIEIAERFQLGDRLDIPAAELAYGEKKRLEMARALASRPNVLLLDEPAAGMNPTELNWLISMLNDIRQTGIAILLVEHHMKLIMNVCDEIVVLNFGSKIASGTPVEISRNPQVISAYLGSSAEHA